MTEEIKKFLTEKIRREFAACGIPAECNCKIPEDVFITMRDGVRLHTWICFPDSAREKFPVILTRTCYPDNEFMYRIYGEELARRGYGFAWQYVRGREQSEGDWIPNIYERNDGIDTVCWLAMQPWCEILGYWGHSYTAMAGWAMADAVEGKVASMYLEDYGTDRFVSAYEKGAFRHDVLTSWSMENGPVPVNDGYEKFLESCRYMPQREVDEKLWGCRNDSYREYIGSPKENDPLWQSGWWKELREIPSKTVIPVCVVSGWYDHHHGSSMNTWRSLSDAAKKHGWLRIGAWNHFFEPCTPGREIANLRPEEMPEMIAWFELTLKKKETAGAKSLFLLNRWGQMDREEHMGDPGAGGAKLLFWQRHAGR
ncbi:MAG: CocE/NonD family hydrolase [Lachnospiraceae bacterium]|nr:CocE/NonD family hydrolase [Lachnospiraceae bacterium]